jgi:hypothetical protein
MWQARRRDVCRTMLVPLPYAQRTALAPVGLFQADSTEFVYGCVNA